MNSRFQEELSRFEAEIGGAKFSGSSSSLFMPSQIHARPTASSSSGNIGLPRIIRPSTLPPVIHSSMSMSQRPGSATISAPAQTVSHTQVDDDDDILAKLQKYEAEVKREGPSTSAQRMTETSRLSSSASFVRKLNSHGFGSSKSATETATTSRKREKKPKKYIRVGGGQVWEDETLKEWDPSDFRIFCGDLGNDVTDEVLTRTFSRYPSFVKAKVIRDKKTSKTRGFGFVSFKDPMDFTRAMKDLNGKYVGSRPIKLRKSNWKDRNIEVAKQKQKQKKQMGFR